MVRDMVEDSYDLVVAALSRKQQEQLGWARLSGTPACVRGRLSKRLVGGGLDYPGVGATENGRPPEGYPCLVSQAYLGRRAATCTAGWRRES